MVTKAPKGASPLVCMSENPGADMIYVRGAFGVSSVVLVSQIAMRDVFSTNPDDFEEPWGIRAFLSLSIGAVRY